jgi:hypothetical protein
MIKPALSQGTCPTAQWPKVIGSPGGDTLVSQLDIKAGKLAALIDSSDSSILGRPPVGGLWGKNLIVLLYSLSSSNLLWGKVTEIGDYSGGIAMNSDASRIVIHSWSRLSLMLLNGADGSIL